MKLENLFTFLKEKNMFNMKLESLFTFLKEKNIIDIVKIKLLEIIEKEKDLVKKEFFTIIDSKAPNYKELAINWIINAIDLPFPVSLFKGTIKKTLDKNFIKLIDFIKDKVEKI